MGHMNVVENLRPLPERVGCAVVWPDFGKHETYTPGCFECFIANGGGND